MKTSYGKMLASPSLFQSLLHHLGGLGRSDSIWADATATIPRPASHEPRRLLLLRPSSARQTLKLNIDGAAMKIRASASISKMPNREPLDGMMSALDSWAFVEDRLTRKNRERRVSTRRPRFHRFFFLIR